MNPDVAHQAIMQCSALKRCYTPLEHLELQGLCLYPQYGLPEASCARAVCSLPDSRIRSLAGNATGFSVAYLNVCTTRAPEADGRLEPDC